MFESYRASILQQDEELHKLLVRRGNDIAVHEHKLFNAKAKAILQLLDASKEPNVAPELSETYYAVFKGFQQVLECHYEYVQVSFMA